MNVYKIYYDNDQDFNKKMKLKITTDHKQNSQSIEEEKDYNSPQSYIKLGDVADNNAIKHITKTGNKVFISLDNHNYIIVMNYDRAIKDRVFEPIKEEIDKQLEKQKNKEERKITRSNKITSYLKEKGIALPLSLMIGISTLGFAIVSGHSKDNDTDQTLSVTPIVEGSPENQELPPTSMVTITPNNEVSITPKLTPDIINTSTPDDSLVTDNIPSFYYDYEDRSNSVDLYRTKELYGDIIEKTANTYGLDPNLVLAIATQERGIHSSQKDPGGATGLMQIQGDAWIGEKLTVHNFISGQDETIIIQEDDLKGLESNIETGCIILQDAIMRQNANILAGVQCYSMGCGTMKNIIDTYANMIGSTREEVLSDQTNCDWRILCENYPGDSNYLNHVFSYIGSNKVSILQNSEQGEIHKIEINIVNNNMQKDNDAVKIR